MEPFIGLITIWPSYLQPPPGFLLCYGQKLQVQDYQALYYVIGNKFGGTPNQNFMLPDFRSRVVVGASNSNPNYQIAMTGGAEQISLGSVNYLPPHQHFLDQSYKPSPGTAVMTPTTINIRIPASASPGTTDTPGNGMSFAQAPDFSSYGISDDIYGPSSGSGFYLDVSVLPQSTTNGSIGWTGLPQIESESINSVGQSYLHYNLQPYLAFNFIIAYEGTLPVKPS